jgi:hypothetical protein
MLARGVTAAGRADAGDSGYSLQRKQEVFEDMRHAPFPANPAADLSAQETAALRRGGFAMIGVTPEGPNALTLTAADYAVLRETSLSVREAARRLELDPSGIWQLLTERKIYGLQVKGVWKIPLFQLDGDRLLPGLEEVVPRLAGDLHPVAVHSWFTTPNPDLTPEDLELALSPREWLLAGYPPKAIAELAAELDSL